MEYKAKNLDTEKLECALKESKEIERQRMVMEQDRAKAYYEGYEKAIHKFIGMLRCINYEKDEEYKNTIGFAQGSLDTLVSICKKLGIEIKYDVIDGRKREDKIEIVVDWIKEKYE